MQILNDIRVATAARVELKLKAGAWQHALDHEREIAAYWRAAQAGNPALFNGRFYILDEWDLTGEGFNGLCRETDYAAFLHWRANDFVSPGRNAFAMPVVRPADGGVLIGRMASWTANAGTWYLPAGSIDESDILPDGSVDLVGNMVRELDEEIGLEVRAPMLGKNWTLVFVPGRLALFREIKVGLSGAELLRAIDAHLAREKQPELAEVRILTRLRDSDDLAAPPFLRPYLETVLAP